MRGKKRTSPTPVATVAYRKRYHSGGPSGAVAGCCPAAGISGAITANDVWGIDFKGWFRTGDGARCEPLSLSDLSSRYVLRLQALERIDGEEMPEPFKSLLVHGNDMTPTLESFHGRCVHLRVLGEPGTDNEEDHRAVAATIAKVGHVHAASSLR